MKKSYTKNKVFFLTKAHIYILYVFCIVLYVLLLLLSRLHMPSVSYLRLDGTVSAGQRFQIVNRCVSPPRPPFPVSLTLALFLKNI